MICDLLNLEQEIAISSSIDAGEWHATPLPAQADSLGSTRLSGQHTHHRVCVCTTTQWMDFW
jgi:hypothetical protein